MLATMERELIGTFIDMQALFLPILTKNGNDLDSIDYDVGFDETVIISASAHYTSNLKLTIGERTSKEHHYFKKKKHLHYSLSKILERMKY